MLKYCLSDRKKAEKQAKKYIIKKYGFVPEIKDLQFSKVGGGISGKGNYAEITMSHNGKQFLTRVNYKDKNVPATDNYEKDLFEKEFKNFIKEQFSLENMALNIYFSNAYSMTDKNIRNIKDLFENNKAVSIVVYTYALDRKKTDSFDFHMLGNKGFVSIYEWDSPQYPKQNINPHTNVNPEKISEHIKMHCFISEKGIKYSFPE